MHRPLRIAQLRAQIANGATLIAHLMYGFAEAETLADTPRIREFAEIQSARGRELQALLTPPQNPTPSAP